MKTSYTPARLAVFALLALPLCQLQAQTPTPSLAPVVVTATRTATLITDQLSEVTLISRQDIERSGAQSLVQLLSLSPGLQVSPESVRGATASVFIRGSNNQHALVLVDGQRVSSATVGATAMAHLPLEQIDRVEVLRGSASSLYGSDALGGVIQVFTRQGERAPAPEAALTWGSYGTRAFSASYGGKVDGSRFRISLGRELSSGFSDIKAAKGGYYDSFNPDRDGYQQSNMALSLSQQLSPQLELGASYWASRSTKRSDNINCDPNDFVGTSCTTDFDNREQQRLESWQLRGQYRPSPAWTSVLRLGQSRDELRSWLYNPGAPAVTEPRYTTTQQQLVWQNDVRAGPGILMTALERRQTEVNSTQSYTLQSQDSDSLVLGYQAWLGKHLLQANSRKDWVTDFANQSTHSLGYGYKFQPQWLARASVGTGYKVPTFNDLYWPLDRANFYQGNPRLLPERSKNSELGVSFQSEATKASVTLYRNVVSNIIVNSYDVGLGLTTPVNVNTAVLRGLSLNGSQRWTSWTFAGAFDALHAKDTGANLLLPRRVPRTATLDASRSLGAWNYGSQLALFSHRFNDKENLQRLSGYGLLHMKLGYALSPQLRLQADLKNVLDKDHVQSQGLFQPFNVYAAAGRSVFVTLRYAPQ
jgi:vitamin B12 transporter